MSDMRNAGLPCEIVRDLLPSYAEGLTSGTTSDAVELHLEGCAGCRDVLADMKADGDDALRAEAAGREIDYLRKIRKHGIIFAVLCSLAAALLLCAAIYIKFFLYSGTASEDILDYKVTVDGNIITFSGNSRDVSTAVSDIKFEDNDGIISISAHTEPKVFWNSSRFYETFMPAERIREINVCGITVWEDGQLISPDIGRMYAAKTPYIGDISAAGRVAAAVGVQYHSGPYTNEFQTSREPYGWIIRIAEPIDAEDAVSSAEIMKKDAYLLIALIDNLGYVSWEYETAESDNPGSSKGSVTLTVTADEASDVLGSDIKSCADSAVSLSEAVRRLR